MDKAQAQQTDTRLAELYEADSRIEQAIRVAESQIHYAAGDKKVIGAGRRAGWRRTLSEVMRDARRLAEQTGYGAEQAAAALEAWRALKGRQAEISVEVTDLEAVYQEHRWNRYFLVTNANGHVHRGMNCPTCFPTTEYAWLPELADCDEAVMIEEFGEKACTVCFPDAPANPNFSGPGRRDREALDARAAEKAARLAAKYRKTLRPEEAFSFKTDARFSEHVTTVAACLAVLRSEVEFRDYYGHGEHPSHAGYVEGAARAAKVLLAREAACPGTGATQAQIDKVIANAVKKERSNGARLDEKGLVKI